ncbi:ATP-binding protein [Rhizocola hellebori]|nr:ATP-binding protein [Rhizocola hellebori]
MPHTAAMTYASPDDLAQLRRFLDRQTALAGSTADQSARLKLAVNELVTNTLRHTCLGGVLRVWSDEQSITCEVTDHGRLPRPAIGPQAAPDDPDAGRGLHIVQELCDEVHIEAGPGRNTARLSVSR